MRKLSLVLLSTMIVMLAWCRPLAAQTAPDKITLGTITLSLNNLPIYVAQDKGFFAKENLFVEAVVLNASTRAIPAPKAWTKSCNCSSRTAPCDRRFPKPISIWT
jgi:ABC-type nitrate/sulfonate/bicarbonate transport system substrate-binding protein